MRSYRAVLWASCFGVVALAGCGEQKTSLVNAEKQANANPAIQRAGVTIDCPDTVTGGSGTQFNCQFKGKGGEATVKFHLTDEAGDNVGMDAVNAQEVAKAIQKVNGPSSY